MGSYLLSHLHALGGGVVGYIVPFLFVLSLVVFFHELGHFLIARLCGVRVLAFSIGFGPELIGFNDRLGTRWKIAAIPLGGYVKFFGDENAASTPDGARLAAMNEGDRAHSFFFQPVFKRAAIVVAGPMANFVLAITIFALIFMLYGKQTMSARVDAVQPDSAAAAAGFQPGDVVTAINGQAIGNFTDMQRIVSESAGDTLKISVDRKGTQLLLQAAPVLKEVKDAFGNVHRIGILGISRSMAADDLKFQPVSPPQAVWMGVQETWFVIDRTLSYIGGVVVGREAADQLG
jgi:regulator of sigma E protease